MPGVLTTTPRSQSFWDSFYFRYFFIANFMPFSSIDRLIGSIPGGSGHVQEFWGPGVSSFAAGNYIIIDGTVMKVSWRCHSHRYDLPLGTLHHSLSLKETVPDRCVLMTNLPSSPLFFSQATPWYPSAGLRHSQLGVWLLTIVSLWCDFTRALLIPLSTFLRMWPYPWVGIGFWWGSLKYWSQKSGSAGDWTRAS